MSALSPPYVEIAFSLTAAAMASATRTLVGREVTYDAEVGVSKRVDAPRIVGVSRGVEVVAVGENTLALLAEAEPEPEGFPYSSDEAEPLRFHVRKRMLEMAAQIEFVYAAILVEEPLESVEQLLAANGSYAFRTFALSGSYFGDEIVAPILRLLPEAYSKRFEWGWFVSVERNMMPVEATANGLSNNEGIERSLAVSRLVASALRSVW